MSRGKNFNDFYLRVDNDGLPFTFDDVDNPEHPKQIFEQEKPLPIGNLQNAFDTEKVPF